MFPLREEVISDVFSRMGVTLSEEILVARHCGLIKFSSLAVVATRTSSRNVLHKWEKTEMT